MKVSRGIISLAAVVLLASLSIKAENRALTVFIGDYPKESGWNKLHSSNDRILILGTLEAIGFQKDNIICLEDSRATFKAINDAFDRLIKTCRSGDFVYIHFSCHGQWITDIDGDEYLRNSKDPYDESIIPYDAALSYGRGGYKGESHLVDDRINEYLCRIEDKVGKKGRVLVIFDACHSGDVQRIGSKKSEITIDQGMSIRGVSDPFLLPPKGRSCYVLPRESKCMIISACGVFENNYECNVGGIQYGRLSYAVSRAMKPRISPESLRQEVERQYVSLAKDSPLPHNRTQSPRFVIPEEYSGKRIF